MAIATGTAILGAALLGAGATVIASNSTGKAAERTADQNTQLARDNYEQNRQAIAPWAAAGLEANNAQGEFMRGPAPAAQTDWDGYMRANPDVEGEWQRSKAQYEAQGLTRESFAQRHWGEFGQGEGRDAPPSSQPRDANFQGFLDKTGMGETTAQIQRDVGGSYEDYQARSGIGQVDRDQARFLGVDGGGFEGYKANTGVDRYNAETDNLLGVGNGGIKAYQAQTGTGQYNDAIDKFLGIGNGGGLKDFLASTGYQFNLESGTNAVQRSAAAKGLLKSGAMAKDLETFGQGLGQTYGQQYFGNLQSTASQRDAQGLNYSNLLASTGQQRESQGLNYLSGLSSLGGQRSAGYQNYTQNQFGLAGLQQGQAGQYLGEMNNTANRGLSATNALAGVGTNMTTQVTNANNAALEAKAGSNASMANGVNGALSNALGAYTYSRGASGAWGGVPNAAAYNNPLSSTGYGMNMGRA